MKTETRTPAGAPREPIDWSEIRRRLTRAWAESQQTATPTEDERRMTLRTRAKALARELKADGPEQVRIEIIEFVVAQENYAIESCYVREVYPLKDLTPLPGTPAFSVGVMNVRGQIVSVIDPKKFFGLPEKGLTDLNKVILLSDGRMEFGLLADDVLSVRHLPVKELQPSLPTLTGVRAEFLKGVSAESLVVLDGAKLLSDPGVVVRQEPEAS